MKKLFVMVSILTLILFGCSGRSDSESEKKQFIEVLADNNQLVGIMEESKSIEEFTKKLDIESWEYCDILVNNAKLTYTYIGYEVVDDPFYLESKKPYIIKNSMELYEDKYDFYIVKYTEDCKDIVKITKSTGKFLSEPTKLNLNSKGTAEDIISKWKTEIDQLKDWSENSELDDDSDEGFDIQKQEFTTYYKIPEETAKYLFTIGKSQ